MRAPNGNLYVSPQPNVHTSARSRPTLLIFFCFDIHQFEHSADSVLDAIHLLQPDQLVNDSLLSSFDAQHVHTLHHIVLIFLFQPGEDPGLYLEKRPLSSPVLLFDGTTSIVAVGNRPVCNLPQEDFWEGILVLMAYYYTLHLTYPKCVATVLSVIQTVVIGDAIHGQDATGAYKKAIAEWKSFTEK